MIPTTVNPYMAAMKPETYRHDNHVREHSTIVESVTEYGFWSETKNTVVSFGHDYQKAVLLYDMILNRIGNPEHIQISGPMLTRQKTITPNFYTDWEEVILFT